MRRKLRVRTGFTVLELAIAIAIICILATLSAPNVATLRDRAEKVVCIGHLRSLHCSLGSYLNDYEQWPQCPESLEGAAEEQFWFDALKDYGALPEVWLCPSLVRRYGGNTSSTSSGVPKMHYTPTPFDDLPMTPRNWPSMPWLIEIDDAHHGGSLLIRTDGSIQTSVTALQESRE